MDEFFRSRDRAERIAQKSAAIHRTVREACTGSFSPSRGSIFAMGQPSPNRKSKYSGFCLHQSASQWAPSGWK